MNKKTILISGSTSGIGKATAYSLSNDFNLIICGRNTQSLSELEKVLSKKTNVFALPFDISNKNQISDAIKTIPSSFFPIYGLINNAGNAHGLDFFQEASLQDFETMIDVNVKGLITLTKYIVPLMIKYKKGHIINIGSIAGVDAYPKGNIYCVTKAAVKMFTKTLRMDLIQHNIKISEVKPGLVDTNFSTIRFKGNKEKAKQVYQNIEPVYANDIAETILFILNRPYHVNIAEITVLPSCQASSNFVFRG